ncbi:disulfide bond formation protein B [Candidatus Woesearchaeota archaeon]|nr:disulfide bond formation protein B [Candidatus Woesearchaeota archaeon]
MDVKVFVPEVLSALTLISDIIIVILFIYFLYRFILRNKIEFIENFLGLLKKYALVFAFIVALAATLGSLFYSEVMGYEPCKLCWLQRIFMYPLVVLFGMALAKNDRKIADYSIALAIIGAPISLYHYFLQTGVFAATCGIDSSVPCTIKHTVAYGYITIPMMALTAFILILILMCLIKRKN